jgi:hypothetical protein
MVIDKSNGGPIELPSLLTTSAYIRRSTRNLRGEPGYVRFGPNPTGNELRSSVEDEAFGRSQGLSNTPSSTDFEAVPVGTIVH